MSFLSLAISGCGSDNDNNVVEKPETIGYLYTTTNGEGDNTVLRLTRFKNGSLGEETSFQTNGQGGTDSTVGGPAHGDYDTQGAIQILGDYLFTVNGGDHTISIFSLDRNNGDLTLLSNVDSGGILPASISFTKKPDSENEYWAIVANQWNNPNIQFDGDAMKRYPSNEYFEQDLTQPDPSDATRNIVLFSFDANDGSFTQQGSEPLATYAQKHGGPTTVVFSDDGSKVAVATWGVPHLFSASPSADEMLESRVYAYDFDKNTGVVSHERFFEEQGISGTVGINWAKNSNDILHVSNINQIESKMDNGLVILKDSGAKLIKEQNFKTGAQGKQDYACWTALSPSGDRLYVSSFYTNVVTPFIVNSDGKIDSSLPFAFRGDNTPEFDTKDIWISPDNKYLYNIGAFQTYSVNSFSISENSLSYESQFVFDETKEGRGEFRYHFMGLTGFDL